MQAVMNVDIMSGAGNIFSVIDNRYYNFDIDWFIKNISKFTDYSEFEFDCEGVIILNQSNNYDFDVWFLNPDGTTGMMCGNGGRCAVEYAIRHKFTDKYEHICFSMANNFYNANKIDNLIELILPPPKKIIDNLNFIINNIRIKCDYIEVGSDHVVIDFDNSALNKYDFRSNDLIDILKQIRYFNLFEKGVNVNLYKKENEVYHLRTYERGVEKITGACGTGAISTAISIYLKENKNENIRIIPPSGEELIVNIILAENIITKIKLVGNARIINNFEVSIINE